MNIDLTSVSNAYAALLSLKARALMSDREAADIGFGGVVTPDNIALFFDTVDRCVTRFQRSVASASLEEASLDAVSLTPTENDLGQVGLSIRQGSDAAILVRRLDEAGLRIHETIEEALP